MARELQHRPDTQFFGLQTTRSTGRTTTIKKTYHAYCHDDTMTSDSLSSDGIALGGRSRTHTAWAPRIMQHKILHDIIFNFNLL